jgi:hypothetical protein
VASGVYVGGRFGLVRLLLLEFCVVEEDMRGEQQTGRFGLGSQISQNKLIFSAVCNHVGFCSATTYCFLCRRRIDFGALVSAA